MLNTEATTLYNYKNLWKALLFDLAAASDVNINYDTNKFSDLIYSLSDWMNTNLTALLYQTMTCTLSAVTGSGTGQRQYIKVDKYGYELQHIMPETVKLECVLDSVMGTKSGYEKFE